MFQQARFTGVLHEGEAASNPHMLLPGRRLADAQLKHAGVKNAAKRLEFPPQLKK